MTVLTPRVPYWQISLQAEGEAVQGVAELGQALQILVTTPPGSVPLDPEFGCDLLRYLSQPAPVSTAAIIREVSRAVARWEPRVTLDKIQVVAGDQPHQRTLRLVWHPAPESPSSASSSSATQTTDVALDSRYVRRSEVGAPGGVAPLDGLAQVPERYLPAEGHDFGEVL